MESYNARGNCTKKGPRCSIAYKFSSKMRMKKLTTKTLQNVTCAIGIECVAIVNNTSRKVDFNSNALSNSNDQQRLNFSILVQYNETKQGAKQCWSLSMFYFILYRLNQRGLISECKRTTIYLPVGERKSQRWSIPL